MIHQQLSISGLVQGVGFRPFVYRLAGLCQLSGHVENVRSGVTIQLSGTAASVAIFKKKLLTEHPVHAIIESIQSKDIPPPKCTTGFRILTADRPSSHTPSQTQATEAPPDLRTCETCLQELFTPQNRRYLYPFINCTDCGPRYSIMSQLPYERQHTSMSTFKMCLDCSEEYQQAENTTRRFHAQANTCKVCGPSLAVCGSARYSAEDTPKNHQTEPIEGIADAIRRGDIVAVKGIGGIHLICDAQNTRAVQTLRKRKNRPAKPFAIMTLNAASLAPLVEVNDADISLLQSPAAPIVLMPKQKHANQLFEDVAPQVSDLACMLPYTAIHYLLFHALLNKPKGLDWLDAPTDNYLLITSANLSGEPIIYDNDNCLEQLSELADFFLLHDRDIVAASDDSVIQAARQQSYTIIRRARGYAPLSINIPQPDSKSSPSILACGAHLKNTFCLTQANKAYLSPHMGELSSVASCLNYRETIDHYLQLFKIKPDAIACDYHPDYYSTRFAEEFAAEHQIPLIRVQHHNAHIAAVLAEQANQVSLTTPILGLALDGLGLGDQGLASLDLSKTSQASITHNDLNNHTNWGGELFYGQPDQLQRIGHLSTMAMPGGDQASREIWRLGAGLLINSHPEHLQSIYANQLRQPATVKFIHQQTHSVTSSAGRWFDAVASILGIQQAVTFEGQAAMNLEHLTSLYIEQHGGLPNAKSLAEVSGQGQLDLKPIIAEIITLEDVHEAAARFHIEFIDGLTRWLLWAADKYQTSTIACSGGCFQNRIVREELTKLLIKQGMTLMLPKQVPTNDGGISLGQAWLASLTFMRHH
jgi:hydrogenase maturation protein HypF